MSQPSFQVDLDGLGLVITRLKNAETAMSEAMQAMHATGGAEMVGTKKLDDKCNDFQRSWKYGFGQIHKDIEGILEGLSAAKNAYAEIDAALAAQFPAPTAGPAAPQGGGQ
jgi:hypothetical protein